MVPRYDRDAKDLWLGDEIIKEFKQPAPEQEMILKTFQEERWPACIDDPLPPVNGKDPKDRLHDVIGNLNRNQRVKRIRFRGDGTGEGIQWELV